MSELPSKIVGNLIYRDTKVKSTKMFNSEETFNITLICTIFSHPLLPCIAISKLSQFYPPVRLCAPFISTFTTVVREVTDWKISQIHAKLKWLSMLSFNLLVRKDESCWITSSVKQKCCQRVNSWNQTTCSVLSVSVLSYGPKGHHLLSHLSYSVFSAYTPDYFKC